MLTFAHPDSHVTGPASFLDLNGTLVDPVKPAQLDALTLIPGVVTAVARLPAPGFVCPVVTVQSRIAQGLFSLAEFEIWFASFAAGLQARGARIVGPSVCPHRFAEPCPRKRPNTLLYQRAVAEHRLKPADCFAIGVSPEDLRAAARLGARGCLVRSGWASDPRLVDIAAPDASLVADSLTEVADWILRS